MSKYLDYSGLNTLWDRIKSYVTSSISSKVDKITSTDNAVPKFDGTAGALLNSGVTINDSNHITAAKFITSGGTSALFLKADGSVDSNTYLTSFTETDPVFTASAAHGITSTDITNWNNKQDALEYYKEDSATSTMLGNLYFHSGGVKQSGDGTSLDNWVAMYGIANTGSTASTPVVGNRMASASGLFSVGVGASAEMSASNIFDYINSFNIYTDSARLSQLNGAITISNAEQYYPDGNTSLTPVVNTSNIYLNTNGHLLYNNKEVATTDLIVLVDWEESDSTDDSYIKNKPIIPSAPGTLNTTATTAQSTNASEALSGNVTLHKVSKTGSYTDLLNTIDLIDLR